MAAQILPLTLPSIRDRAGRERPICANPNCQNPATLGKNGNWRKYCADPQCPKSAWYHRRISAAARQNSQEPSENSPEKTLETAIAQLAAAIAQLAAHTPQPHQLPLFPPNPTPKTAPLAPDERFNINVEEAKSNQNPGANLRICLAKENGDAGLLGLSLSDIRYGVEMKDIPQRILDQKIARFDDTAPTIPITPAGNARPLAHADRELAPPPDLEELELEF
jgi:hypothetical protein